MALFVLVHALTVESASQEYEGMELGEVYDKGVRPRRHSIAAEGLLGEIGVQWS